MSKELRPGDIPEAGDTSATGGYIYWLDNDGSRRIVRPALTPAPVVLQASIDAGPEGTNPVWLPDVGGNRSPGWYLKYPVDVNSLYPPTQEEPVNQAPAYYRIRRILGEHALRYLDENPIASMRLSDPTETRIHVVNYELTEEERIKAANNDYQTRGTIGYLWRLNEELRLAPRENPNSWQPPLDHIEAQLAPFCELCEGAGLSYRTIHRHPHLDWRKWQRAGLRFNTDRAFEAAPIHAHGIVTPEAHARDLRNFRHALDFAAEGHEDRDFEAPIHGGDARFELVAHPAPPVMPVLGNMTLDYIAARWRLKYDAYKAGPISDLPVEEYRAWAVTNLLVMLEPRNWQLFGGLNDVLDASLALEPHVSTTQTWPAFFGSWFAVDDPFAGEFGSNAYIQITNGGRNYLRRGNLFLTDGTATNGGGPWVDPVERDRRLDLVDAILGDETPRGI